MSKFTSDVARSLVTNFPVVAFYATLVVLAVGQVAR